jgi:hypothetical protein
VTEKSPDLTTAGVQRYFDHAGPSLASRREPPLAPASKKFNPAEKK